MSDRITAPFTESQVAALNAFQRSGVMGPFTCGNEQHRMHQTLIAESDGWHCPEEQCDYRQDWAHAFMAQPLTIVPQLIPAAPVAIGVGHLVQQPDGTERPGGFAYVPNPALAELAKVRQQLRATEDELAESRRQLTAALLRIQALQVHEAIQRIPAQPPDSPQTVPCGEILHGQTITTAGSIDTWQERTDA